MLQDVESIATVATVNIIVLCHHFVPSFCHRQVMIFGLSHGTLRGSLQLLCASTGYMGAVMAFVRSVMGAWDAQAMGVVDTVGKSTLLVVKQVKYHNSRY